MRKMLALAAITAFYLSLSSISLAEEGNGPNIILIVLDTARADHFGCYGYKRPTTPNIDEIAKEAAVFENALSVIPLTTPAHVSVMTGVHPGRHLASRNLVVVPEHLPMLAQVLKNAGYATAASVSSQLVGSQLGFGRGFDIFYEAKANTPGLMRPGNETVDDALQWLSENFKKKFFLWVHLYDPHLPYEPPDEYGLKFNPAYQAYKEELGAMPAFFYNDLGAHAAGAAGIRKGPAAPAKNAPSIRTVVPARTGHIPFLTPEKIEQMIAAYDGELAFDDDLLGKIFLFLKEKGVYKDTVIIIMGDHGEILHEKADYFGHHEYLYQGSLHIPLIMRFPGAAPRKVRERITIVDVLPTLLDALGIKNESETDGVSFWGAVKGMGKPDAPHATIALTNTLIPPAGTFPSVPPAGGPRQGAQAAPQPKETRFCQAFNKSAFFYDNWKIIKDSTPQEPYELYDLGTDPQEAQNIYGDANFKETFMGLQPKLESYLYDKSKVLITTKVAPHSRRPSVAKEMRSLGYLQ